MAFAEVNRRRFADITGVKVTDARTSGEIYSARMPANCRRALREVTVEAVDEVGNPTVLATFTVIAAILPIAFYRLVPGDGGLSLDGSAGAGPSAESRMGCMNECSAPIRRIVSKIELVASRHSMTGWLCARPSSEGDYGNFPDAIEQPGS